MTEQKEQLKINKTSFKLDRKKTPVASRPSFDGHSVKSSYEMPSDLHKRIRMFCAKTNRKLNEVFAEALEDLLMKYGEN